MYQPDLLPPKMAVANLLFRKSVRAWALRSAGNRKWLWEQCAKDFVIFLHTFAWLVEPRAKRGQTVVIPFILWSSQYPLVETLQLHAGLGDIGVAKARAEGCTWVMVWYCLWRWLFYEEAQFIGIVSRTELAADSPGDIDSCGGKLDWGLSQLPAWLVGKPGIGWTRNLSRHLWINNNPRKSLGGKDTFSTIASYSSTGDVSRGGRKTLFVVDEFAAFPAAHAEDALAAMESVSESRIFISTQQGTDTAFYRLMEEQSSLTKLYMRWTANPTRNQDMFCLDARRKVLTRPVSGEVLTEWGYAKTFFDDIFPVLQRRGYDVMSPTKLWSPWFVSRCLRARMTPRRVAEEYEIDALQAGSMFFPASLIETLAKKTLAPRSTYMVEVHPDKFLVTRAFKSAGGPLKLWVSFNESTGPPRDNYVFGIDIASGTGGDLSSNSVISIASRTTGTKVGEYVTRTTSPEALAEVSVALARWFRSQAGQPAYVVYENNGFGTAFGNRLADIGFSNIHYRLSRARGKKRTKEPGFQTTSKSKPQLFSNYRWALSEGFFDNPSLAAVQELACYSFGPSDRILFSSVSTDSDDLASAGQSHGDRVVADALCNLGVEELNGGAGKNIRKRGGEIKPQGKAPPGSYQWRQERHKEKLRKEREHQTTWSSFADYR